MENQKLHSNEKHKFALYVPDHVLELARKWYQEDNCSSLSEFICKAIEFYTGFVSSKANPDYMPKIVISTLKAIVNAPPTVCPVNCIASRWNSRYFQI